MKDAFKTKIGNLFAGNIQYEIPFFQRQYVWKLENWQTFWETLCSALENDKKEYFIGSVIFKEQLNQNSDQNIVELIDGQQRLTTIAIFFKALKDTLHDDFNEYIEKLGNMLCFVNKSLKNNYRIKHSKIDSEAFLQIMEASETISVYDSSPIVKAYRYFCRNLSICDHRQQINLMNVLIENFVVVTIHLDMFDDEQDVFDTINSLGVRLTFSELIKNYIFKDKKLLSQYEEKWESQFEDPKENLEFWKKQQTSRKNLSNLEMLFFCFLTIQTEKTINFNDLFKTFKGYLDNKSLDNKIIFLEDLGKMANLYRDLPRESDLYIIKYSEAEKCFFHILEKIEATPFYPLILFLYKEIEDKIELMRSLKTIESYIVLRNICRLTNKAYNVISLNIIKAINKQRISRENLSNKITSSDLEIVLASFNESTNRLPSKIEIEEALLTLSLPPKLIKELLYIIVLKDLEDENKNITSDDFVLEEIISKNMNNDKMSEYDKFERNKKINTFGNKTLVVKNQDKNKNTSWMHKRKYLEKYSPLKITTEFIDTEDWTLNDIESRAKYLTKKVIAIWG